MFVKLSQQHGQEDQEILAKQRHEDQECIHKVIGSLQTKKVDKEELQILIEINRKETEDQLESVIEHQLTSDVRIRHFKKTLNKLYTNNNPN